MELITLPEYILYKLVIFLKLPNAKVGGVLSSVRPPQIALALVEDRGVKDTYFVHINPTPTTLAFFNIVLGT